MRDNLRGILLAALMIMAVAAGGVAATTEWQDATSADQNLDILQGTEESTQSYNVTVNASELTVDAAGGGDEVVLVSSVNATNISGTAVASPTGFAENQTSKWTYDTDTGLWYRSYNYTTAQTGDVTFEITNGTVFNATNTANNWTISTAETTDGEQIFAGAFAGDAPALDILDNTTTNVTYEVIDDPVDVGTSFESDITNGTTASGTTVEVDQASKELTVSFDAENISSKDRGIGTAANYTLVLNKSLGTVSETTVTTDYVDNVDITGPDTYDDDNNQWTVDVTNISNASTVTMTVNVSDVPDDYNQSGAVMVEDIDYTASVVGDTVHDESYTVEFTEAEGAAPRAIAFPGLEVFTDFLGGTWGAVAFWFLVGSVIIMAGMAIWQLREQNMMSGSRNRALAYFGIAGSTLAVIFGMTIDLGMIAAVLLVALAASLAVVNIWLYSRGESMSVNTSGGSGGATYVR